MAWQVEGYSTEGERPFDQGSFGTVWRARRRDDGVAVALKLVLLTDAEDARDRIAAERHGAMLQQRFHHAHGMVPEVFDYGLDAEGHLFIAMEMVDGGALSDLIRRGPLDPREAAQHAVGICEFLDRAHRFATTVEGEPYDRLVHADLKPGHVLINPSGGIRVLDFGIAKALSRTSLVTTNNWGTSAYASPERLEHGHVNEHVDFWSLGVILYEMVAGHRPYPALDRNRSQLEHAIRTNRPRQPLPRACPPELAAIVDKLLAYQIDRRYASAADIETDLERFLAGEAPLAMQEYVTPATMPIGQSTMRRATPTEPRLPTVVPATDPLPASPVPLTPAPAASTADARVAGATARRVGRGPRRTLVRAAAWAAIVLIVVGLTFAEGLGWVSAERYRRRIASIDRDSLDGAQEDYNRLRTMSLFDLGARLRVDSALRQHLIDIADSVIEDYRREEPMLDTAEWKHAQQALQWATRISAASRPLEAKLRTCEAHVIRLSARGQSGSAAKSTFRRAVEKFRDAADLDDRSMDPYLGISRIAVYGLDDLDEAAAAIHEAERRGYVSGIRERALMGDGYLRRANASRGVARRLSGEQRRRELEKARDDYQGCIAAFDPIVGYGYSAKNLESCKTQLRRVEIELDAELPRAEGH